MKARPPIETRDICQGCGKSIPAQPAVDEDGEPVRVLCVGCRYAGENKPKFDDGENPAEVALKQFDGTPAQTSRLADEIEDFLQDHDVPLDVITPNLIDRLEDFILVQSDSIAAEKLRDLSQRLTGTTAGEGLARVLHGDAAGTLEEAGKRCGKSKVAVFKSEARIRQRLKTKPVYRGQH